MKNLTSKFTFFSLLAMLTVTIFMTSCGKEDIQETESIQEINEVPENEDSSTFTLPEAFDKMTDEELAIAVEEYSEEGIMEFATLINTNEIESRWCTPYYTIYQYCRTSYTCWSGKRARKLNRRYCTGGVGYQYYWSWGSCC